MLPLCGRCMALLSRLTIIALAAAITLVPPPEMAYSAIFSKYRDSVAFVTTEGTLFNNLPETIEGSGFLIFENQLMLTNNHVVLERPQDYKAIRVSARFGSRTATPIDGVVVSRDIDNDLALVRLAKAPPNALPVTVGDSDLAVPGLQLCVLGFPLIYELNIVAGLLSAKQAPNRWLTDAALNPGNSGGPVFDLNGRAIGVASGAAVTATVGGQTYVVEGIKFFVPINVFLATIGKDSFDKYVNKASPAGAEPRIKLLETISRSYTISELKDDHSSVTADSQSYKKIFQAEPGYRIVKADLVPTSEKHVSNSAVTVAENGSSVTVEFRLTSGPSLDRYPAWFYATVITTQRQNR